MKTEKLTVRADELKPGDRIVPAPGSSSSALPTEVRSVGPAVAVNYVGAPWAATYEKETVFRIERPVETVTVELPRKVAELYADRGCIRTAKAAECMEEACYKALHPAPVPQFDDHAIHIKELNDFRKRPARPFRVGDLVHWRGEYSDTIYRLETSPNLSVPRVWIVMNVRLQVRMTLPEAEMTLVKAAV